MPDPNYFAIKANVLPKVRSKPGPRMRRVTTRLRAPTSAAVRISNLRDLSSPPFRATSLTGTIHYPLGPTPGLRSVTGGIGAKTLLSPTLYKLGGGNY
jgi:hypothetical protein